MAAAASDPVLVIAGDISCGPTDPNFGGGNPADCQQRATANLIAGIAPNYLMPGGTAPVHPERERGPAASRLGLHQRLRRQLGPTPEPEQRKLRPRARRTSTPGDDEYGDGNENDIGLGLSNASNYYSYFGGLGRPSGRGERAIERLLQLRHPAQRRDLAHHLARLRSALPFPPPSAPGLRGARLMRQGSPEETFLHNDLAAHQGDSTLIHWHEPEWSEGANGTDDTIYQAFWNETPTIRREAIVNGHDHDYERWQPLNASGTPDANGVDEMDRRHRGKQRRPRGQPERFVVSDDFSDFGVLELTLHAGSARLRLHEGRRWQRRTAARSPGRPWLRGELQLGPGLGHDP